jgi:hypothetical protein
MRRWSIRKPLPSTTNLCSNGPAGIPVYWIVNLKARQVEVYTLSKRRGAIGYGKPRIFKTGQSVPVVVDGKEVGRIAVVDILPPSDP